MIKQQLHSGCSSFAFKYNETHKEFGFKNAGCETTKGKKRGRDSGAQVKMASPVQVLDSLGGRSSLVRDVTMEPGLSEVVLLTVRAI